MGPEIKTTITEEGNVPLIPEALQGLTSEEIEEKIQKSIEEEREARTRSHGSA